MNESGKIELLSPAGSFDALKQAIHNEADAVYLGGNHFGARAYANNFDNTELKAAIDYAHLYSVKIYVTVNTLVFENETADFMEYIRFLVSIGTDALIMQDIGMAHWVINTFDIPVHSSTQMHNYSLSNIEYLKEQGFSRAVAARETNLSTISKMSEIIETEIFIHGALCISYSGQCLFSAIELGRSGNRGKCAQVCRMKYTLCVDDQPIVQNKHLLSPKDLALLEDTASIVKVGAGSLKLEGRMKAPEYVGYITKTYRKIIDNLYLNKQNKISAQTISTLKSLFNRGFTKGYAFGHDNKELMRIERPNHAGVHIGDVTATDRSFITVKLCKPLHQGDGIKFDKIDKGFICNKIFINGKLASTGEAGDVIRLENKIHLNGTDKLLLTKDVTLLKSLDSYKEKNIPIKIDGKFIVDKPCEISILSNDGSAVSHYGAIVQKSKTAPVSKSDIFTNLEKLGGTPYIAESIQIEKDPNIFISKSSINQLRREAVALLSSKRTAPIKYTAKHFAAEYSAPSPSPAAIVCTVSNEAQLKKVLEYNVGRIYARDIKLYNSYKKQYINVYYFMPALGGNTENFDGERLVIRDTGGIKYAQSNTVIGDYMLNTANSASLVHLHSCGLGSVCLSVELSDENTKKTASAYRQHYDNMPNAEILVYGRIQLMVMKHCILEGKIKCDRCKTSKTVLKDIHGHSYPVKTDDKCSNYIYSKEPVDKTDNIEYFKLVGINGFRLDFLDETPEEIALILKKVLK